MKDERGDLSHVILPTLRQLDCARRVVRAVQVVSASMLSHALLLISSLRNETGRASFGTAPEKRLYARSTSTRQGRSAE